MNSNLIFCSSQYQNTNAIVYYGMNTLIDSWKQSLDIKHNVITILLDFSKAFDTVDHSLLLENLYFFNFSGKSINLIKSYLVNHFTITKFNRSYSSKKLSDVGIPHGSVLGPLLFIIFAHDSINLLIDSLTSDLLFSSEWLRHNRLILNMKKTKQFIFQMVAVLTRGLHYQL